MGEEIADATSHVAFSSLAHSLSPSFKYHKTTSDRSRTTLDFLLWRTASSRVVRVLTRGRGERLAGGEEGALAAAVASSPAAATAAALLLLLLLLGGGLLRGQLLLLGLGRAEVGVLDRLLDVHAVVLPVGEAAPDEVLGLVADGRLRGELHLRRLQDDVLLQDRRLRLVVSERLK